MRLSPADASRPPLPWRTLARIAAGGLICALLVLAGGWALRRAVFGRDESQARARVEAEVRSTFDAMSRQLRDMAAAVADPALVRAAADDDTSAVHRLLTRAAEVVARDDPAGAALTIYGTDGTPLAWAGRPSELLADRLQGREAWFPAPVAQGLRLIYVQPLTRDGARVGTIAVERPLPSIEDSGRGTGSLQGTGEDAFRIPTTLAPVSIQLPFEGAPPAGDDATFDVQAPSGERLLSASVAAADLATTRERWRRATRSLMLVILAITLLVLTAPLLDWRNRLRSPAAYSLAVLLVVTCIVAARFLFFAAAPADWSDALVFSTAYASALIGSLLASPFDFVLTAGAAVAIVVLLLYAFEAWRVYAWRRRQSASGGGRRLTYVTSQLLVGVIVAVVLLGHEALLRDTVSNTTLDLLQLSLNPWNTARIAMQAGLLLVHVAALGLCVLVLGTGRLGWRIPRRQIQLRLLTIACWLLPLLVWQATQNLPAARRLPLLMAAAAAVVLAAALRRLAAWYRRGSQAFRLTLLTLPLIAPAFAFYPTVVQLARQAKTELVETLYAPEVRSQRQTVQSELQKSQDEIDRFAGLVELVTTHCHSGDRGVDRSCVSTLADHRTGQVSDHFVGRAVRRRWPAREPLRLQPAGRPDGRDAALRGRDVRLGSARRGRTVLRRGAPRPARRSRAVLRQARRQRLGSIVVHAMLDYENLPFISSRSPYVELLRPADALRGEGQAGDDVEFAVYGWSRTPLYPVGGHGMAA